MKLRDSSAGRARLNSMRINFGKYAGEHLEDIPTDYLVWLQNNVKFRSEILRQAVDRELRRRSRFRESHSESHQEQEERPNLFPAVRKIYRDLCLEFHPDKRGGSSEAMKAVNAFWDRLSVVIKNS